MYKADNEKISYPQFASGDRGLPSDGAVEEIISKELKYKRELWRLQKILRRSIAAEDPLPVFNRRHLLILVKRLCKDLDYSSTRLNNDMDMTRLSEVLESSTQLQHNLSCVAYSDALYEIRELLQRETKRRGDRSICYCTEIHGERALLPLHRLKYLKALVCLPKHHRDLLSTALDGCFEALTSLHTPHYVGEIDNLLDLAFIMDPPPVMAHDNLIRQNEYNEIVEFRSIEEPKEEDHIYEEIEMVPLKTSNRKLSDLFFNPNKKNIKHSLLPRSRFTVSTTNLCS